MLVGLVAGLWAAPGNELDDHDGLDRSMRFSACEVIPLVTRIFLPPRVQHYRLPELREAELPRISPSARQCLVTCRSFHQRSRLLGSSDEFNCRYSFLERWTTFLNNVIVPLHRSPLLPLQLRRGKHLDGPEHHEELQRYLELNYAIDHESGIRVCMDEALFFTLGYPILHEYTSTSLAQRSSLVAGHTYGLRDPPLSRLWIRAPFIGIFLGLTATSSALGYIAIGKVRSVQRGVRTH